MRHFRETIPQLFATHSQGKASQLRHITRKRDQLLHNEIERKKIETEKERTSDRNHIYYNCNKSAHYIRIYLIETCVITGKFAGNAFLKLQRHEV